MLIIPSVLYTFYSKTASSRRDTSTLLRIDYKRVTAMIKILLCFVLWGLIIILIAPIEDYLTSCSDFECIIFLFMIIIFQFFAIIMISLSLSINYCTIIKKFSMIILMIVLQALVAYELGIFDIQFEYVNIIKEINIVKLFEVDKNITKYDISMKFFISIIPNYIFSRLLILGIKYITNQKISLKDYNLFNKNVAKSINIYVISFIAIFLYINIFYLQSLIYLWLSEFIKHILPNINVKLQIIPEDGFEVLTAESGSVIRKDSNIDNSPTFNFFINKLIGIKGAVPPNGTIFRNNFGSTFQRAKAGCDVFNSILSYELNSGKHFLADTVTISDNPKFSAAVVITEDFNKEKTLVVSIKSVNSWAKPLKDWFLFSSKSLAMIEGVKEILNTRGVHLTSVLNCEIKKVVVLTPYAIEKRFYTKVSKYFEQFTPLNTESFSMRKNNYTALTDWELPIIKPDNLEVAFSPQVNKEFRLKKGCLEGILEKSANIHNYFNEIYFSNKKFSGVVYVGEDKYSIHIADKENRNLPWVHSIIDPKYIIYALDEIDSKFGLCLADIPLSINNINIYTQGNILSETTDIFKILMPSKSYYVNIQNNTVIDLPYRDFLLSSINLTTNGNTNNDFFNILKGIVSYLNNFNTIDYSSLRDRVLMAKTLKKELVNSIFYNIINSSIYKNLYPNFEIYEYDNLSSISLFRCHPSKPWTVFCISKRSLFEGFSWVNDNKINITSSIDTNLKKELAAFLDTNSSRIQGDHCRHEDQQLNIMFWDNFCVEFGIADSWCSSFYCPKNDFNKSPNMYGIMWKDQDENEQKILNILNMNDQTRFFYYLNRIYPYSETNFFFIQ